MSLTAQIVGAAVFALVVTGLALMLYRLDGRITAPAEENEPAPARPDARQ
jgi:hypothetical protein